MATNFMSALQSDFAISKIADWWELFDNVLLFCCTKKARHHLLGCVLVLILLCNLAQNILKFEAIFVHYIDPAHVFCSTLGLMMRDGLGWVSRLDFFILLVYSTLHVHIESAWSCFWWWRILCFALQSDFTISKQKKSRSIGRCIMSPIQFHTLILSFYSTI